MGKFIIVETTCKSKIEAKKIAKILLDKKLIACAQISTIESLYCWKGKTENEKEFLLSLKTKADFYKKIEAVIIQNHSYELPQIIATKIEFASEGYLKWLSSSLR